MTSPVPETLNVAETTTSLSTLDLVVRQHNEQSRRSAKVSPSQAPMQLAPAQSASTQPATAIGRLVGFDASGHPLVALNDDNSTSSLSARSTQRLHPSQINSEVVLIFVGNDREQPIIMGCLVPPMPFATAGGPLAQVELNDQRLVLAAQEEIVLRCGKSSITLTQAGKVIIRGEYLLSRSAGVNRIKGGSVQIN